MQSLIPSNKKKTKNCVRWEEEYMIKNELKWRKTFVNLKNDRQAQFNKIDSIFFPSHQNREWIHATIDKLVIKNYCDAAHIDCVMPKSIKTQINYLF